ncbi:hypothetical protein Ahia01_000635100 [Argonauta hians]
MREANTVAVLKAQHLGLTCGICVPLLILFIGMAIVIYKPYQGCEKPAEIPRRSTEPLATFINTIFYPDSNTL